MLNILYEEISYWSRPINSNLSVKPSYVGYVDISITNDTEAKVKAIYGSDTSWTRIQDKGLFGAGSIIGAGATGGSNNAIVPYHTHPHTLGVAYESITEWHITNGGSGALLALGQFDNIAISSNTAEPGQVAASCSAHTYHTHSLTGSISYAGTSGNTTNANIQASYGVYIWVRTA